MGWNQVGAAVADDMYGGRIVIIVKKRARGDSCFLESGGWVFPKVLLPYPTAQLSLSRIHTLHLHRMYGMASSVKNKHLSPFIYLITSDEIFLILLLSHYSILFIVPKISYPWKMHLCC